MSTQFPAAIDTFVNPQAGDAQTSPPHHQQHGDANDAIKALETKLGIDSSTDPNSVDYRLNAPVWNETPTGTINGVNVTFFLAKTPKAGSLVLTLNGVVLKGSGSDYTQSGTTITLTTAPVSGDVLVAAYTAA